MLQVNQENVVKVGHKQVVNTIRHGGNRLIIKVVTVSRNLDPDDTARKKGKPFILSLSLSPTLLLCPTTRCQQDQCLISWGESTVRVPAHPPNQNWV